MQFGKIEFVAEAETTGVIKTNPLIYHNEMDSSDTTDWLYFNHRRTIPTSLPRPTKPPRQINRDRKTNLLCRDATDLCSVRDTNRVASLHAGTQRTMENVNNRNTSFEVCFGAIERPIDVPDGFGTGTCELSSRRGRRRINKPTRKLISQSLDQDNWILLDPNERTEIGKKGKPIDMGIICTTKSIEIVPVPVYPQETLENPNKLRVSVPIDLSSKYPLNAITTLSRKPDVFLVKDHTPEINNVEKKRRNSTSTIHRNSILHRDCNWVKPLTEDNNNRECDHITTGPSLKTITASQKNVSKSISNLNVVNSGKSDSIQRFANSKFYVPLSEEQDNRSNKKEQRTLGLSPINTHLSASEGNLSNTVKVNSVNNKSNLEWVYCPSVLFNRLRVTKQNFVNNSSNKNSVMDKNDENENQLNWKQLLKRKLEKTFETKKKKK